ncbi:Kelch repeat-containing protein [Rubrolithibacter danxiaensis]|uniref:Kelch repeat-containing protein n=1 Tax=Rubrolithibacter danxiaensis TaxID=3390805 RepID=UPI003BF89C25
MKTPLLFILAFLFILPPVIKAQNGHWKLISTNDKIEGRSECGLAAVNGKLYLLGGQGAPAPVEIFNPATSVWTKKATAPAEIHHFQPVVYKNKIYVLEAFSGGTYPDQHTLTHVYSYDTEKDRWKKEGEIPAGRRRAAAGAAVYKGKIYLVNGIQHGHVSGTTNMFDEYDPETKTWRKLPNAPHIRDHSTAVVVNDKLYAIGGRNTSYHEPGNFMSFFDKTILEVDCFDFKTGKWSTLDASLPLGTGGGTAVNLHNKIFYIGGERATKSTPNGPQKDVYYLDPAGSTGWIHAADLNKARNGVGGAILNDKIYIAGGAGSDDIAIEVFESE